MGSQIMYLLDNVQFDVSHIPDNKVHGANMGPI